MNRHCRCWISVSYTHLDVYKRQVEEVVPEPVEEDTAAVVDTTVQEVAE